MYLEKVFTNHTSNIYVIMGVSKSMQPIDIIKIYY